MANIGDTSSPAAASVKPAFSRRSLILGHGIFLNEWERWVERAAASRLNSIFFHTIPGPLALGAAPESLYLSVRAKAVPAARAAGMTIEWGGHHLSSLVPRALFLQRPKLFRMKNGRRRPDTNFCVSNPETLKILARNAERLFRRHPEVDVFHIWADDLPDGGWCSCPDCAGLSASDQYFRAFDVLSNTLAGINPKASISFLAYYDTEAPPVSGRFRSNAELLWAPRPRCYAHGLGDPCCPINSPIYGQGFSAACERFRAAGGGYVSIFEYGLDGILFKSAVPPLVSTLAEDLRFYAGAGADAIGILLTGDRPVYSPGPNLRLFGRLSEDLSRDPKRELLDFCGQFYGEESAEDMVKYWLKLEKAWHPALDRLPGDTILSLPDGPFGLIDQALGEPGDPKDAALPRLSALVELERGAFDTLAEAGAALKSALERTRQGDPLHRQALEAEAAEYELHEHALDFWFRRARVYAARSANRRADTAEFALQARRSARRIQAWGRKNLRNPKVSRNFIFLNFVYRFLPMDAIRRSHSGGPLRRTISRFLRLAELSARGLGVRRTWEPRRRVFPAVD